MADNPFDQFDAKPAANPFDQFDGPAKTSGASAAPAGQDLGTTAFWNKPADASWPAYLMAHLASAVPSGAFDPHVNANEAVLLGSGLSGGLSGFVPGMRERTAQAEQETPFQQRLALQGAGYALGPGKLGIATKLGEGASSLLGSGKVAQWAGGVLGSAGEGGLASGVGEAGAGGSLSDIGKATGIGILAGGAGGVPGGVVGRGGALAAPKTAADLKAAAKAKYDLNDPVMFDGPGTVHPALDAADANVAKANLTGQQFNLATSTKAALADFRGKAQYTATDLDKMQGRFDEIANSPRSSDQDKWIAPHYSAAIEDVMKNGTPFNAPTGWAADTRDAADSLHGMAKDTKRLNDWIDESNVGGPGKGPDVGAQMKSWLLSDEGKAYAPQGTPQFKAANALAATAQKPLTSGAGLTLWDLKHHLLWPAIGLAGAQTAGAFGTTEGHQPWWANIPEDMLGLGAGFLLKNRLNAAAMAKQGRAIDAYRTTASTGQFQAPVMPTSPLLEAVRQAIYGRGAGGGY